jgi:hypothetical protein
MTKIHFLKENDKDTLEFWKMQGPMHHTPRSRCFSEANILSLSQAYADLAHGAFVDCR